MALPGLATVFAGLVAVHLAVAALVLRWRWQRRERPPVTEKLLRAPGERLRQRLEHLDERLPWLLIATLLLPIATLTIGLGILPRLSSHGGVVGALIVTFGAFLLLAGTGVWLLVRTFNARRDFRRALQGERTVAEALATLVPAGYRIFHDLSTESAALTDNIHHVVVGPAGVFAIETQTHPCRRKPIAGRKPHEIIFDGDLLVYPWGQDTEGLVPARQKAVWLSDWVYQIVGERIPVAAVLTFPGWWVTPMMQRDVRVHNPNQIAALILESNDGKLSDRQRDLIVRQLENRCRDVEF